jgi:hypothetical protein
MAASNECRAADTVPSQGASPAEFVKPAAARVQTSNTEVNKIVIVGQSDRDKKPYRNLVKAMNVFERNRRHAPDAVMRFKVFPWHDESVMRGLTLTVRGNTVEKPVSLADDGSFALERDALALDDDAEVVSNRARFSLAWRADIRTPGLPANTRRLGDLRLECKVDAAGTGADLATSFKPPAFWAMTAVVDDMCLVRGVSYVWLADQPVFSVTLVSESRRQTLPSAFYMHAFHVPEVFSFMDWHEHLRDRVYSLPLWDTTWPDDALVVLEPMENSTAASAQAAQ